MNLRRDVVANYLGAASAVLASVLALPVYLSALGPQQFGLIAFLASLQSLLGILDAGASQALVREIATRYAKSELHTFETFSLIRGFSRAYWTFAAIAGGITMLFSEMLASQWLNLDGVALPKAEQAIIGAAALFAVQFPGSLYRSILLGTHSQVRLNVIMGSFAIIRHAGGALTVMVIPDLSTYLIWHIVTALLETLLRRSAARHITGHPLMRSDSRKVEWAAIILSTGLMSLAALFGSLTLQMDRLVLSRMVSVEQLGYYTIAATVAVGLLQLIYPITQAYLPRVITAKDDAGTSRLLFLQLFLLLAAITCTVGLFFHYFGRLTLELWLHDDAVVDAIHPLLSILLVGTALNAFYNVGYLTLLARNHAGRILGINATGLLISVTLTPALVASEGPVGAAFGWVALNAVGLIASLFWSRRVWCSA